MLYRLKAWAIGRVLLNWNMVALEKMLNYLCCMNWSIVLLKFSIANSSINVVNDREEEELD